MEPSPQKSFILAMYVIAGGSKFSTHHGLVNSNMRPHTARKLQVMNAICVFPSQSDAVKVELASMETINGQRKSYSVVSGLGISNPGVRLTVIVGVCGDVPFLNEDVEIVLGDVINGDSVVE